jgi:hypothetical protein
MSPIERQPLRGWNDYDASDTSGESRLQVDQQQTADQLKELTERIGIQGSTGSITSRGVSINPGDGIIIYQGGIGKTNIQPDGDFFAGRDINLPAGMSFAIFAVAQPYNGEAMEEGDLLIGDNSEEKSNIKWDASEGQFQFRLGVEVTAYMDTDGTLVFEGGTIGGWEITAADIRKLSGTTGIILDSTTPKIQIGDTGTTHLVLDGANQRIRSSNFATGATGFNVSAATGDAEFNNITARGEIKTFLLTASNQMAVAGNILVSKDAGKLGADVSSGATTVNFGKAMTPGDWIKIQGPDSAGSNNLEWMLVGSNVSGTTYNVTRNVDGSGANGWLKDTPFVVIGQDGDSRIELVAGASASIQLITQGAAWNTQAVQASMSTAAGAITAGGDTVLLDDNGIQIVSDSLFGDANGYKFIDSSGNIVGGTYGVANSGSAAVTISLRAQDTVIDYVNSTASVDAVAGALARARLTVDSGGYGGAAGMLILQQEAAGTTLLAQDVHTIDLQQQTILVINDDGLDADTRIETDANANALLVDASAESVYFFGTSGATSVLTIDGGTDKRLEIGADHYFPTRDSTNKNGFWNEANQDMDFTFEGTTDANLLKVDAFLNAVGIGGAASNLYKLRVHGTIQTDALLVNNDATVVGNLNILTSLSVTGSIGAGNGLTWDGWQPISESWTRTGNHTFTVSGDLTAKYRKGTKVRYQDGGSNEYGVVASSSHAAGTTTVNLIPNTDYAMAAATITARYISFINNPEGFPEWFSYTPTMTASGSMTFTTTTTIYAKWRPAGGQEIEVAIFLIGTTGGTASNTIYASVPATIASPMTSGKIGVCQINDGGARTVVASGYIDSTNGINMYKANDANFALAANRVVIFDGTYPI